MSISAVLTVYKRPHMLKKQLTALSLQTEPIEEVFIVVNDSGIPFEYTPQSPNTVIIKSSKNFKFHSRFAIALLCKTDYIAVFDDDVLPGSKWLENCMNCIKQEDAIYGGAGVRIRNGKYSGGPEAKYGWNVSKPENEAVTQVDLVGHAWFFKRAHLQYMWREDPISWDNGEDIQFSYLCQKYGNLRTLVPPHPKNNIEMWCNTAGHAVGNDENASWIINKDHGDLRTYIVQTCITNGWKTYENF